MLHIGCCNIMTCSHNVVFLLDTASSVQKLHLHLGTLRILNYLGCRFGLAKVRWGFKFFDSLGGQGRASRVGSLRELGSRSWEEFEEELETRFRSRCCSPHLPGSVSQAAFTGNILKETLLDYQWDRPEIASPAKPILRNQKSKFVVTLDKPPASSIPEGFVNAIFLFSPCPHSQRELLHFISESHVYLSDVLPSVHDLTEKIVPKGIQEMMANQKITLFWVDTTEKVKCLASPDHIGYWMLVELMQLLGGTILPSETLIPYLHHYRTGTAPFPPVEPMSSELPFGPWTTILPFNSTLDYLLSLPSRLQSTFLPQEGVLFFQTDGAEESQACAVLLEPLTVSQKCFTSPANIYLKNTMTGWDSVHAGNFYTESWVLRSPPAGQLAQDSLSFQQFAKYILAQGLHMVAEVSPSGSCSPCTGILSPISDTAVVLSLLWAERTAEVERTLFQTPVEKNLSEDDSFSLPEIVSSVLHQVVGDSEGCLTSAEPLYPEWAQQELSHTYHWNPAVTEGWYSFSNLCGASSQLMESLRLLEANPAIGEEEASEPEGELMRCLSEFYQRKTSDLSTRSHQQDHRKRCGVPRTPVRQKMKTMPRSLQMLNVARLNVKAQKFLPNDKPSVSKKVSQRLQSRRSDHKLEERVETMRTRIGFRTEEEMLSYITANYQKAVIDGENVSTYAQDMVTAVYAFQKANETACMDTIRSSLLKSGKVLRQQLGHDPDKELKECQLQVYLRLEMCLQCPSFRNNADGMEQLVEEITEMLRILCLTKDPGYLTSLLEEIVETYTESMPKTLGDLYYSLGTQVPPKLASVLPADFFSDDSRSQESQTPSLPASAASVPLSRAAALSTETDRLEELRTRSAKKRKSTLARHRSVTESSQNLRQIEIPQIPRNRTQKDNFHVSLDVKSVPAAQKMAVQVTKVRRNLFNKAVISPSKRSLTKIPRSQSVSAVEGLKCNQSNKGTRGSHRLLTKRVAETPLHKQISNRLLHKQITGRSSDPGSEVGVVEESPERNLTCGLRRSPRVRQQLLDRILYSEQVEAPCDQDNLTGVVSPPAKKAIQSPKSLLFGAVVDVLSTEEMGSSKTRRKSLASSKLVYQTPRKNPLQSSQRLSPSNNILRRSPRIQGKLEQTPQKTSALQHVPDTHLEDLSSPCRQKNNSWPKSTEKEDPLTEKKKCSSLSKVAKLQTLAKQARNEALSDVFVSSAGSSDSVAALSTASPFPLSSRRMSFSQLQSPRRSLRIAQKMVSPTPAQRHSLVAKRLSYQELPSLESDSVLSEVTPTVFGGTHSEPLSSPKSAKTFSPQADSALLLDVNSPPCNSSLIAVATCTLPSPGTQTLSKQSCTPKKSPLTGQNATNICPAKAVRSSCMPKEHLNLYRSNECQYRNNASLFAKTNAFCKPENTEGMTLVQDIQTTQHTRAITPTKRRGLERHPSPKFSPEEHVFIPDAVGVGEPLETPCLVKRSFVGSFPVEQGSGTSQNRILPAEATKGLQHPLFQSPLGHNQPSWLPAPKSGTSTYALRCTPERKQREAAARLGNPESRAMCGTPRTIHTQPLPVSPPTYEVELEMQASGLPKLRIKKVASGSALELQSHAEPGKPKAEENDPALGDLSVAWCGKHSGKADPASSSPSCIRSAHSSPGRFGGNGQTYICQSYTPTHCASSVASPSQSLAGTHCTPSPKHKGRITPEAIKDWPRKKRAAISCSRSDKQGDVPGDAGEIRAAAFFNSNKALLLGEFELEGVCKLQDQSPSSSIEPTGDERISRNTSGLKFRKRAFEHLSPEEETSQEVKRSFRKRAHSGLAPCSTERLSISKGEVSSNRTILEEEEIFSFSGLTPPKSLGRSTISASGLLALTQSPLLCHTSSTRKSSTGDASGVSAAVNEDFSPFQRAVASRQRSIGRTYSRKRLLC